MSLHPDNKDFERRRAQRHLEEIGKGMHPRCKECKRFPFRCVGVLEATRKEDFIDECEFTSTVSIAQWGGWAKIF